MFATPTFKQSVFLGFVETHPPDLGREASRERSGGGERLHELLGRVVGEPPVARQPSRVGDNLRLVTFLFFVRVWPPQSGTGGRDKVCF